MRFRWWVVIAAGLFFSGFALGLTVTQPLAELLGGDIARLRELAGILTPFTFGTAVFIYLKNVTALLVSFAFSPLLCLMPIISMLLNGWLIAFIAAMVVSQRSLGFVLAGILPHGVFELPALILGGAAALNFGVAMMRAVVLPDARLELLPKFKQNLKYLGIAALLLLPAAIIETFITPLLVR
ncbi:MAG: stage II sporulation protein M [Chloroflexota bacterium]